MKKKYPALIALCFSLLLSNSQVFAQDDKKNESRKEDKEYKMDKEKKDREYNDDKKYKQEKKDKDYNREKKDKDYNGERNKNDDKYGERRERPSTRSRTGIPGRVILPRRGTNSPRQLEGVPKGHYPPPGSCRIWYPNRPAGQQPPPASCSSLYGVALEPGAFILHGERAYDADYNWKEEERRRPGTVSKDILDILFPNRQ